MWCKVYGPPLFDRVNEKSLIKILLASLIINDKDCRNERRANNVMKIGDMCSEKVFVSSTLFSLKYNLISPGLYIWTRSIRNLRSE
jgi:hypothetical protein